MPRTFLFFIKNCDLSFKSTLVFVYARRIFTSDWLKGIRMLVFDVVPNCLMIAENGCIRRLPCFFCAIESTVAGVIRHTGWNNRQEIGCSQAKLICFHLL